MFGDTPTGRDWCIKALHPSDPAVSVVGVPDQSCASTVFLNWQQTNNILPPSSTSTSTWSADIHVLPTPFEFGNARATQSGETPIVTPFPNLALGASGPLAYTALSGTYERWRLAYMGVTVYHDAPALSNQGTVVAAQYVVEPTIVCPPATLVGNALLSANSPVVRYQTADLPVFERLITMPNAMAGQAKDGVYMPLRLDSNHCQWQSGADRAYEASSAGAGNGIVTYSSNAPDVPSILFPDVAQISPVVTAGVFSGITGGVVGRLGSPLTGGICFTNLSAGSRLTCVWRVGFECMVQPGTAMTSFQHVSPAYDRTAIDNYYRISRELKDAYPADYNDLGKMWDVVKKAANFVAPVLRLVPGGAALESGARFASGLIDPMIAGSKAKSRDGPPAAALERQIAANHVVRPVPVRAKASKMRLRR